MGKTEKTFFVNLLGETFKKAREISLTSSSNEFDENQPTLTNASVDIQPPDEFPAIFGCYRGETRTDIGWLTGQREIQLRFHSNALQIWSPKLRNSKISLKVSPIGMFLRHWFVSRINRLI